MSLVRWNVNRSVRPFMYYTKVVNIITSLRANRLDEKRQGANSIGKREKVGDLILQEYFIKISEKSVKL
jgi:hypothetical protein